MTFHDVMTARFEATQARDPDSLHGALIYLEAGGKLAALEKLARLSRDVLRNAYAGYAGRVPAFKGEEYSIRIAEDFQDGILPYRWKRELVALLLRPDGLVTPDLVKFLIQHNRASDDPGGVLSTLRAELKPFGVKLLSERIDKSHHYRFRIAGKYAWRMQKIIANGWSV